MTTIYILTSWYCSFVFDFSSKCGKAPWGQRSENNLLIFCFLWTAFGDDSIQCQSCRVKPLPSPELCNMSSDETTCPGSSAKYDLTLRYMYKHYYKEESRVKDKPPNTVKFHVKNLVGPVSHTPRKPYWAAKPFLVQSALLGWFGGWLR